MADAIKRIKCGQIFIMSNNDFALICDFCGRDVHTLEFFRSHVKEHFPDSEDEVCISSDSECEYVPPDTNVQLVSTLQNDNASGSQTAGAENLLIELDWLPLNSDNDLSDESSQSERSVRKHHKRKRKKRTPTIPSTTSNGNDNISEANVANGTRTTMICSKQGKPEETHCNDTTERNRELHECRFCNQLLSTKRSRIEHEHNHTGNRFRCEICSRNFTIKSSLDTHNKVQHSKDLRYPCSTCGKKYVFPSLLDTHVREKHLPDSDPRRYFECIHCDGKFKTYATSRMHKPCKFRK